MISYVDCLGRDGAGNSVASQCWNSGPDEEQDQLLPRRITPLQPKTEGSLRRRLLTAKIHQHHEAIWGRNAGMAGWPPSGDKKHLPPHLQYPNPWYGQNCSPQGRIYTSVPSEVHGKPLLTDIHGKQTVQSYQVPRPALTQWRRTSSYPPTPEPRPGYTPPDPSPLKVPSPFKELEVAPQYSHRASKRRKRKFFSFKKQQQKEATPLLHNAKDGDRWSIHYTTQKPQQGLFFIPAKKQHASAEDLQAFSRVTQHGDSKPTTSLLCTPSPTSFTSPGLCQSEGRVHRRWRDKSRKMSSASSDGEETVILNDTRPLTPLVLNPMDLTTCWDVFACETDLGAKAEAIPRLPTPEERMRQQADAVTAEIVPINITGQSFDRQASFRKVADSSSRRHQNLNRHMTHVTGNPVDVINKQDSPTDQCSRASPLAQQEEEEMVIKKRESLARKIRAPTGQGLASLMMSLTSPRVDSLSRSSDVRSLPRMATSSSLDSDASCNSVSYRTLSASSSCSQDFPSELQPLLPCDLSARVTPQCPSPSHLSKPASPRECWPTCSCDHVGQSQNCTHCRSPSTSIADAESLDAASTLSRCGSHFSLQSLCPTGGGWTPINLDSIPVSVVSSACSSPCNFESVYSEDVTLSSAQSRSRSSSTSSSSCRSISLRKSKRPPLPPLRSDSLRRRISRSKSCRTPSSLGVERSPRSSTQTLHDPWVPRNHSKRRQSGIDCGTVTTFEPFEQADSYDKLPSTNGYNPHLPHDSPISKEEGRLQCLAPPSSGYSSQFNPSPTGTPPGAFSVSQNYPFFYPYATSLPLSPKKSKPHPPERRSSLLSSISSSFSSTSSLSSCSSSNSSTQRTYPPAHLLPTPPPPPPLPTSTHHPPPLQLLSLHPTPRSPSSLPPPPPLPLSLHPTPLPPSTLPPHLSPFTPSSLTPPPPLPPSSLPLPPAHLQTSSLAPSSPLPRPSLHPSPLPPSTLPLPPPLPPSNLSLHPTPTKPLSLPPTPLLSSSLSPHPSHFPSSLPSSVHLETTHLPPSSLPPSIPLQPPPLHLSPLPPSYLPPPPPPLTLLPSSLPPSLPPSSIPTSLPPPLASRPPPPPYSHAIKQSSHHAVLFSTSPAVTHQLARLHLPPGLGTSPNCSVKGSNVVSCPLVTAQALRSVKLRSIANQEVQHPKSRMAGTKFSDTPRLDDALSLHTPAHDNSEQQQPEILSSCMVVSKDESHIQTVTQDDQLINGQIHLGDSHRDPREVGSLRKKPILPQKPSLGILGVIASPEAREKLKGKGGSASDRVNPQSVPETTNNTKCVVGPTGNMLHSDSSSSNKGCHSSSMVDVLSSFDGTIPGPWCTLETLTRSTLAAQIGAGTSLQQEVDKQCHRRMMRSLGEDEEEDEEQRKTTMMFANTKNSKSRKKRRAVGRQLLMMSSGRVLSSSSSSSSSSSDEEAESQTRESSLRALIGPRSCSLSSVLSSDNLQGAVSLSDLLIEEPQDEEEVFEARKTTDAGRRCDGGSPGPRTTEDLFTVIHRSKRKMFGRRDSSSLTSSDPRPRPTPQSFVTLKGKRSAKSERFKTLLLRKGSRLQSSCRISAVERLRIAAAPAARVLCTVNTQLTLNVAQTCPNMSTPLAMRQTRLYSPHFLVRSSLATRRCLHTAPCSASRRLTARHRHFAGPMTAIYEKEGEEE
ncbi:uncharacterized protein nhsl1a isoform X2 [Vanacampus margaritifer]